MNPKPSQILIPDFISYCTFSIHINPHAESVIAESTDWLLAEGNLTDARKAALCGLKGGELAAVCFPHADFDKLRVCCDFINFLFHIDDLSDDMNNKGASDIADEVMTALYHPTAFQESARRLGKMTRSYWNRLIEMCSSGAKQRFMSAFDLFFQAVAVEANDRINGVIPDLESYIILRRDTSACKICWAIIEYANNLTLPDEVMEHPVIQSLNQCVNDFVTRSNDVFSYNREQVKGHTHNIVVVVMHERGIDLQSAVDFVGEMCKQSIDSFVETRKLVPSWSPEIDEQVQIYIDGLADWIVGSLHWSFDSERYFGKNGLEVKSSQVVHLLP